MKQTTMITALIMLLALTSGCSSGNKFHKTRLPDPQSFNAHFGDMDANGDEMVNWQEFETYFPNAQPKIFEELDLNGDENVDHDEWHQFKAAHGLKHKDKY